jgi:carbamoyltransferase
VTAVLGVNAVFHDPAAALVIDGETVAAAEEERFSRRKHGKAPVAFSTWELPEQAMRFCLDAGGIDPAELDAVAYSYDPALAPPLNGDVTAADWEGLRTLYASRAPLFLRTSLSGLDPSIVRWSRTAWPTPRRRRARPVWTRATLVMDGRGERTSHLTGRFAGGCLDCSLRRRCRTRSGCCTRS